jgi:pentatricopeptide repeat protein
MKKPSQKKSSLLAKYSLQYEKKPRSRVFAPLAETYRKLGMHDEALKVLRSGIKYHPDYTLGYIVLSHVYFDKENYEVAYSTLRPFILKNLENITLQKLFAEVCMKLDYLEEALNTYKNLLLINPRDEEVAVQVKLIEDDLLVEHVEELPVGYVEKRLDTFDDDDDDWVQVDFNQVERRTESVDDWNVKSIPSSPLDSFKSSIEKGEFEIKEADLNDEYYFEDHDTESDDVIDEDSGAHSDPIITHTLVDLYCKQGYFDKAIELLDNILELHSDDKASFNKRDEIKEISNFGKNDIESHGHERLLDLVDDQRLKLEEKKRKIETKLDMFVIALREKSLSVQTKL